MTTIERLSRISPFRWRLEWALLLALAAGVVLGEQAREVGEREPAAIVLNGEPARAAVIAARLVQHTERMARGEARLIVQTLVDLEWRDAAGETRRASDFHLPGHIAIDLGIDASAKRWPEDVRIVYLMEPAIPLRPSGPNAEAVLPRDPVGPPCRPRVHCSMVVLDTSGRSSAHEELERIELARAVAPVLTWLSVAGLLVMLGLRLVGIVYNRPSLE